MSLSAMAPRTAALTGMLGVQSFHLLRGESPLVLAKAFPAR